MITMRIPKNIYKNVSVNSSTKRIDINTTIYLQINGF